MSNLVKSQGSLTRPFIRDFFDADNFFNTNWLTERSGYPAVNVAEKENEYCIDLAVPGYKKDDFKIKVNNDMLTVSAEAKTENKEEKKEYTRQEYSYSSFSRSFQLPDNVKDDQIKATYEDGMLKLSLPKTSTNVKASKEIQVS
ncbi:MAG TPA: Hsp20/alpha crystallin family protein [Chitinophagaceae bacterium]|nr:Hsp20/alpha crystallin family protein [Chitinophagaceae bacterium]